MVYLLKMVIFHGCVSHNQRVYIVFPPVSADGPLAIFVLRLPGRQDQLRTGPPGALWANPVAVSACAIDAL